MTCSKCYRRIESNVCPLCGHDQLEPDPIEDTLEMPKIVLPPEYKKPWDEKLNGVMLGFLCWPILLSKKEQPGFWITVLGLLWVFTFGLWVFIVVGLPIQFILNWVTHKDHLYFGGPAYGYGDRAIIGDPGFRR